jgi:hypothetical protein
MNVENNAETWGHVFRHMSAAPDRVKETACAGADWKQLYRIHMWDTVL